MDWGTRREDSGEDVPSEELCKRELRDGIGDSDCHRVSCVAGGLRFTKVFIKAEWNCTSEGVFGKTTTAEILRWRVAWRTSAVEAWCVEGIEHSDFVCVRTSRVRSN